MRPMVDVHLHVRDKFYLVWLLSDDDSLLKYKISKLRIRSYCWPVKVSATLTVQRLQVPQCITFRLSGLNKETPKKSGWLQIILKAKLTPKWQIHFNSLAYRQSNWQIKTRTSGQWWYIYIMSCIVRK